MAWFQFWPLTLELLHTSCPGSQQLHVTDLRPGLSYHHTGVLSDPGTFATSLKHTLHWASRLLHPVGLSSVSTPPTSWYCTQGLHPLLSVPFPWWLTLHPDLLTLCLCRCDTFKSPPCTPPSTLILMPLSGPSANPSIWGSAGQYLPCHS